MKKPLGSNVVRAPILDYVALTISPKKIEWMTLTEQFNWYRHKFSRIQSEFILYPELDKNGRLHFHGKLYKSLHMDKDIEELKKIGFLCTKTPFKYIGTKGVYYGWDEYCIKEWIITKKIFNLKKPLNKENCSGYKKISYSKDIMEYIINNSNKQPFE